MSVSISTKGLTQRRPDITAVIFYRYFQFYFSTIDAGQPLIEVFCIL